MTTANLITASQLSNWMQQNYQRSLATMDEWCWVMNNAFPQSSGMCPTSGLGDCVLIACGMLADGSNRNSLPQISSTQFLSALGACEEQQNATAQVPGGGIGTTVVVPTNTPVKTGGSTSGAVAGGVGASSAAAVATNPSLVSQLTGSPILLIVLAAAIWYLFFDKDGGL